jgi:hypothetical protein
MVQGSSKREYAEAVRGRYRRASKGEKGRILDEFVAATGYHRVYARRLLRMLPAAPAARPPRAPRRRRYDSAEQALLQACWLVADAICSKRLSPFLPELLERLAGCDALPPEATAAVVERVGQMSAATIDRLLRRERTQGGRAGRSLTKPGTLLKGQVPIKTFADWDGTRPGFLEIDLVAHCGASGAGEFLLTLSTVDVATGWSCCLGVRNKGQLAICTAIEQLHELLPFPVLGLDSDNGSEFLNRTLVGYCAEQRITFTRSRPYQKNDNCHVEQKNWSVVRRLVGYARYELFALGPLNRLYRLADDYVNFLQPVLKLVDKTRDGAKVRKRYDVAQTPYQRLLASGALPAEQTTALRARSAAVHPIRLKLAIEAAQRTLAAQAIRMGAPARLTASPGRPDEGPVAGARPRRGLVEPTPTPPTPRHPSSRSGRPVRAGATAAGHPATTTPQAAGHG